MVRVVIYSEVDGVFLGTCLGMGFWSKLDPVGQPSACSFPSVADARKFYERELRGGVGEVTYVTVVTSAFYATVAECAAAGLPAWDPESAGRLLN